MLNAEAMPTMMHKRENIESMLGVYRGLDLSDEQGFLCGKILADLGADVIKVERPRGDKARNIGPFYGDIPHPERSLFWFAFNANKRGITLNIESRDGKKIFKKLVKSADFIIESFPPGYLNGLGLGYEALSEINPRIIMASISPFGQSGPYRDYKGTDIVHAALSGVANESGDPDRAPLRLGPLPQSYFNASAEAALGTCIALYHQAATSEGQHIDVSVQESMAVSQVPSGAQIWEAVRQKTQRLGKYHFRSDYQKFMQLIYPCKDGYICWLLHTGVMGHLTRRVVEWMEAEGKADTLAGTDWYSIDLSQETDESWASLQDRFAEFFQQYTKAEIYDIAIKKGIPIYPVCVAEDLYRDTQLVFRDYWIEVDHSELGATITYPGAFVKASRTPLRQMRRAPIIGEHNQEIYCIELGISQEEIIHLAQIGVI